MVIAEVKTNQACTLNGPWRQVDQWESQGRLIKQFADQSDNPRDFINEALRLMGVQHGNPAG